MKSVFSVTFVEERRRTIKVIDENFDKATAAVRNMAHKEGALFMRVLSVEKQG